ncbi:hypothetical protein HDK77DRAFT_239562 [Phyllosticta capitalensis]
MHAQLDTQYGVFWLNRVFLFSSFLFLSSRVSVVSMITLEGLLFDAMQSELRLGFTNASLQTSTFTFVAYFLFCAESGVNQLYCMAQMLMPAGIQCKPDGSTRVPHGPCRPPASQDSTCTNRPAPAVA